ncbi:MAG: hypothetical protein IJ280_01565, partial [Bacteroidales bacterium]|nr:hypothetical protein [Bacteroidales bacterium]
MVHFVISLRLRYGFSLFALQPFAFRFTPSALPPFALSFTANPSAFARSFPLETHTKFLRRKTFAQYSGLDSSLAPWARYLVAIAQNSIFAQQRFFKIEESRDAAVKRSPR